MNQILEGNPITLGELKAYINSFPDSKDKWPIYVFRLSNPLTGFLLKPYTEIAPIHTIGYPDVTCKPHNYIILDMGGNGVRNYEHITNDKPE